MRTTIESFEFRSAIKFNLYAVKIYILDNNFWTFCGSDRKTKVEISIGIFENFR